MDHRVAARTEQEIVRLCHGGLDSRTLRVEALRRLRESIPVDSSWFATADPASLLFTSSVVDELPEGATPTFIANEFLVQQHLKAVFDQTGVRSRRELVAQLFARQYLPRIVAGAEPAADGWFAATDR